MDVWAQQKILPSVTPSNSCFTELLSRIFLYRTLATISTFYKEYYQGYHYPSFYTLCFSFLSENAFASVKF